MQEKLRSYIDKIFEDAPKTMKTAELKEEILQNQLDKYNDLIKEGKSEEAAFNLAVANIGDVSALLEELKTQSDAKKTESNMSMELNNEARKRSAILISAAVLLYCICVVPVLICQNELGVILMFVMIGVATALIVYDNKTKVVYRKSDDTVVEDFKEWKSSNEKERKARKSICAAMWGLTFAIYFIISFMTMDWYITWVIFLIAGAVENIIKAIFELKK